MRNFIIQLRAYPKDFFAGNVITGIYTVLGALFMYKLLFNGALNSNFHKYTETGFVIIGTAVYLYNDSKKREFLKKTVRATFEELS